MSPADASVYSDTLSTTTWVLFLSGMIVFVFALMVAFIALVHRACEESGSTATTAAPATGALAEVPAQAVSTGQTSAPRRGATAVTEPLREPVRETTYVG